MKSFKVILPLFFIAMLVMSPGSAKAEWFTDGYLGGVYTDDTKVKNTSPDPGSSMKENVDEAVAFGFRLGHYFNALQFVGLALDASYYIPTIDIDAESVDLDVIPISPLLMLRAPLFMDDLYPNGKWQIYGGIGPGIFYSKYSTGEFDDKTFTIGIDARAGTTYMVNPMWGTFIEFRYTSFEPEYSDRIDGTKVEIELDDVTSYHVVFGFSYRF